MEFCENECEYYEQYMSENKDPDVALHKLELDKCAACSMCEYEQMTIDGWE